MKSLSNAVIAYHNSAMSSTRWDILSQLRAGHSVVNVHVTLPMERVVLPTERTPLDDDERMRDRVLETFDGVMYQRDGKRIALVQGGVDQKRDIEIDVEQLEHPVVEVGQATLNDIRSSLLDAALEPANREIKNMRESKAEAMLTEISEVRNKIRVSYQAMEEVLGHALDPDKRLTYLDTLYKDADVMALSDYMTPLHVGSVRRDADRLAKLANTLAEQKKALPAFEKITSVGDETILANGDLKALVKDVKRNQRLIEDGFLIQSAYDADKGGVTLTVMNNAMENKGSLTVEDLFDVTTVDIDVDQRFQSTAEVRVDIVSLDQDSVEAIENNRAGDNPVEMALLSALKEMSKKGVIFVKEFDTDVGSYEPVVIEAVEKQMDAPVIDTGKAVSDNMAFVRMMKDYHPAAFDSLQETLASLDEMKPTPPTKALSSDELTP